MSDTQEELFKINSIEWENFLSYKKGKIELFDNAITVISGDRNGCGKCIDGDTMIITLDGKVDSIQHLFDRYNDIKKISDTEDVVEPFNLCIPSFQNNQWISTPVKYIYRQRINEPMLSIETASGKKIVVTKAHKFYRWNSQLGGQWIKSIELREKDQIGLSSRLPEFKSSIIVPNYGDNSVQINDEGNQLILRKIYRNYSQNAITIPLLSNPSLFELMGWMIAEDYENDDGSSESISICQYDNDLLDHYAELFRNVFGLESKIDYNNHITRLNSVSACEYLKSIGYKFGNQSRSKCFPDWVVSAPLELMNTCLRAYFDGDGTFHNGTISVTSASWQLIHQVYYMLLRNDIVSSIRKKYSGRKFGIEEPYYEIAFSNIKNLDRFIKNIGFSIQSKMIDLLKYISEKSHGSDGRYTLPFMDYRKIRNILYISSNDCKSSGALIRITERKHNKISRDTFIQILSRYLEKINLFESYLNHSFNSWKDLVQSIKDLNIKMSDFEKKLNMTQDSFHSMKRVQKLGDSFKSAVSCFHEICNFAVQLRPHILKMYNDAQNFCFDEIISISVVESKDKNVYDLSVPETQNYVAGFGISCHNTTVAQAISVVLTGKPITDVDVKDMINHESDKFIITLNGILEGESVEIIAFKTPKNIKKEILIGNGLKKEKISEKDAELKLEEIVTNDEFKRLIYISGNEIDALINGTPASRSKILDKILGIQSVSDLINKLKTSRYDDIITRLNIDLNQKSKQIIEIQKINSEINLKDEILNEIKEKTIELDSIQKQTEELKIRLKPLESYKNVVTMDQEKKIKISEKIEDLKKLMITSIETVKNRKKIEEEITVKLEKLLKEFGGTLEKNESELYNAIKEKENELIDLEKENEICRIKIELSNKNAKKCPICESAISPDQLKKFNKYISNPSELQSLILKNKEEIDRLKKLAFNIELEKPKIQNIKSEISEYTKKVAEIKNQMIKYQEILNNLNKTDESKPNSEDLNAYEKVKLSIIQNEAKDQQIQTDIKNKTAKIERLSNIKTQDLLKSLEVEIKDVEKKLSIYNFKKQKLIEWKLGLQNILKIIRDEIINKINPYIQNWMSLFLRKDSTGQSPLTYQLNIIENYKEKIHTINYQDIIQRFGVPISYESLSTGQKAICSLSLILAISDVNTHQLGLIILDELPTSGIDDYSLSVILNVITSLIAKKIRVIFIDRRKDIIKELKILAEKYKIDIVQYNVELVDHFSNIVLKSP